MRIAERERRDLALHVGAIAGAGDVELAREAGGHALYGGGGQRAGEPVQSGALIGIAQKFEIPVGLAALRMPSGIGTLELAFGTFHQQLFADV